MEVNEIMEVDKKGIIRSVDELGRVVLPIEYRQQMELKEKDKVKVCIKDKTITLQKIKE